MSEPEEKPTNRRLHLVFALAVLVGGILLLFALEWGAIGGNEQAPQPPAQEPAPSAPAPTGG